MIKFLEEKTELRGSDVGQRKVDKKGQLEREREANRQKV